MALISTIVKVKNISKAFPLRKDQTFEINYNTFDTHSHNVVKDSFQVRVPHDLAVPLKKKGPELSQLVHKYAEQCMRDWTQNEMPFEKEVEMTSDYYQNEVHLRK